MNPDKIFALSLLLNGLCGVAAVSAEQFAPAQAVESAAFEAKPTAFGQTQQRDGQLPARHGVQNIEAEMLDIPPGCFLMGSREDEIDRDPDEGPQQRVCLDAFRLAKFEVTQGLWRQVMGDNPAYFKLGDQHPVEMVSWHDIQLFLQRLNEATGKHYRLPTEAEWEYAARAGTNTPFWWQATEKRGLFGRQKQISHANANYGKEECCSGYATDKDQWVHTSPVGSFTASPWGTHDMRGNVWEWVQDCYQESYAQVSSDGKTETSGECKQRVFRGGAWDSGPAKLRAANRSWEESGYRFNGLGFRLAQSIQPLQVRTGSTDYSQ